MLALSVRVRFAPSPTGALHLGGLRTALYNYLFARAHVGGRFVLRIEDTDAKRRVPGAAEALVEALRWAGIEPDEGPHRTSAEQAAAGFGPYVQSQRQPRHAAAARELLASGAAYRCFCAPERLAQARERAAAAGVPFMYDRRCLHALREEEAEERAAAGEAHVVRMRADFSAAAGAGAGSGGATSAVSTEDAVRGGVEFERSAIDDAVLLKSDGSPTYHLASVVDDHDMQITHVIRGEEWLPSLPKHALLYAAFGWAPPVFAHLPLLLNEDGTKLSKRSGAKDVSSLAAEGLLPEAVTNALALCGWAPPQGAAKEQSEQREEGKEHVELFSLRSLPPLFSLERVQKGGARLDAAKLGHLNKQHLRLACLGQEQQQEGQQGQQEQLGERRIVELLREPYADAIGGDLGEEVLYATRPARSSLPPAPPAVLLRRC